jgi:hypothetical protein
MRINEIVLEDKQLDELNWKKAAATGALALGTLGAMGNASARVVPGQDTDPGINRLTGKPIPAQVAPSDNKPTVAAPSGYSKEYLQKAADPNRTGRYMISVEKAQDLLKQMDSKVPESVKVPFAGAKVGHKEGEKGQWRNDGPKKNKPAKQGDLVGGGM